jgi:hypothetical protein
LRIVLLIPLAMLALVSLLAVLRAGHETAIYARAFFKASKAGAEVAGAHARLEATAADFIVDTRRDSSFF